MITTSKIVGICEIDIDIDIEDVFNVEYDKHQT